MQNTPTPDVTRRKVFYIPGFDPMPPRRYRELYRTEGAAQASISGYDIQVTGRPGADRFGWDVQAEIGGASVASRVEVLIWADLVRERMEASIWTTYVQLLHTAWMYIRCGALWRMMRLRKGPVIAAFYPVAMLLAQLGLACLAGYAMVAGLEAIGFDLTSAAAQGLGVVAAVLTVVTVLRLFKRWDGKLFAYYLMQDYAFAASCNGANPDTMEARMRQFQSLITNALNDDVDEVLVVGHSSGASLAVSILADMLRHGTLHEKGPKLALLTLGQVVPMTSFLPEADRLRADLALIAAQDDVAWVDVTAPGDGCAFALCDPVAVTGVAPPEKRWPLVLSAAFTQTLSPERWAELRWRFFRLHFQYLCAFDRPNDYDYFRITAGPLTLAARFAERSPSPSRIETPVNPYTSMRE